MLTRRAERVLTPGSGEVVSRRIPSEMKNLMGSQSPGESVWNDVRRKVYGT
jgi:hypothetical protein